MKELNFSELDEKVLKNPKPVILKFWNQGCGPCMALGPVLEDISKENESVDFYGVEAAANEDLVEKFSIMTVPALLFLKDGVVVKKTIGFKSKESIEDIIETYF